MRRTVGVLEVAMDWQEECDNQLACQKWRSIGGESATINCCALSGDQLGPQVWRSLSVL